MAATRSVSRRRSAAAFLAGDAGQRGEPFERHAPQIVVIAVHAVTVALQPAAHGTQEGLQFALDLGVQQRADTRLEQRPVPTRPRHGAHLRVRRLPIRLLRQQMPQPCRDFVDDRARTEVEVEPNQTLALFIGKRRIAESQEQAAREGLRHSVEAPHRVGQVESVLEHALWIAGCRRPAGGRHLSLAPAPLLSEEGAETVEPVAFQPDRDGLIRVLRAEAEQRQFGPAQGVPHRLGGKHLKSVGLHGFDRGPSAFQHLGDEVP